MNSIWSAFTSGSKKTDITPAQHASSSHIKQSYKPMSKAFKNGVRYNMKLVIRGDVMTGKTTLFQRLQGTEYNEAYSSTPKIEVENIPWRYKDSNEMVKIEVWDVVDKAHNNSSKKTDTGIKLEHNTPTTPKTSASQELIVPDSLDATTVDVYRGAHAAIFIFDITKPWTFKYVVKELRLVPNSVSILVLGNFCDKSEQHIEPETIQNALYELNQARMKQESIQPDLVRHVPKMIRYVEASLKSGQGLKYIHNYLGVPFLQLLSESLQQQLELNAVEIVDLLENLDCDDEVPENMRRRRGQHNFNQASQSSQLVQQQQEMEATWNTTLSPDISLDIGSEPFESKLDDWLGDDPLPGHVIPQKEPAEEAGNPMVADDEDVKSIEYYQEDKQKLPVNQEEDDSEPEEESFKSELDIQRLQTRVTISSDSEDEDNQFTGTFSNPMRSMYEDFGDSGHNPWSLDTQGATPQSDEYFENNEDKGQEGAQQVGDTTTKKQKKKPHKKKTKKPLE